MIIKPDLRVTKPRLTALYHAHYQEYFKIACGILRNHASAEEAVQDAICSCIEIVPKLPAMNDTELHCYIRRAVCNRCKNILKKNDREVILDMNYEAMSGETDDLADAFERKDLLQRAASILSENQRKCIYYKDHIGMRNADVARLLGIKEASINMTHKRAKDLLKKEILRLKQQGY